MLFSLRPAHGRQPGSEGRKMTMSPCPLGNTCSKFCVHSRAGWSAPAGQVRAQEVKGHGCKGGGNPAPPPCSPHAPRPFPSADGELAKFLPQNTELLGSASSPYSERSVITELRSEGNPAAACSVPERKQKQQKLPLQSLRAWSRATAYLGPGMKPWGKVLTV